MFSFTSSVPLVRFIPAVFSAVSNSHLPVQFLSTPCVHFLSFLFSQQTLLGGKTLRNEVCTVLHMDANLILLYLLWFHVKFVMVSLLQLVQLVKFYNNAKVSWLRKFVVCSSSSGDLFLELSPKTFLMETGNTDIGAFPPGET